MLMIIVFKNFTLCFASKNMLKIISFPANYSQNQLISVDCFGVKNVLGENITRLQNKCSKKSPCLLLALTSLIRQIR